jgi:hypothetical protein
MLPLRSRSGSDPRSVRVLGTMVAGLLLAGIVGTQTIASEATPGESAGVIDPATGRVVMKTGDGLGDPSVSTAGPAGGAQAPGEAGGSTASKPKSSGSAASTTTVPTLPPPVREGWDYGLTLSSDCVPVGGTNTASFDLAPYAHWVLLAVFSDGSAHEVKKAGLADPLGKAAYTFVIPSDAPPGIVSLTTQAYDPNSKRKGTKEVRFRVPEAGKSC